MACETIVESGARLCMAYSSRVKTALYEVISSLFVPMQCYASAGTSYGPCLSVCVFLSEVGILLKWMDSLI